MAHAKAYIAVTAPTVNSYKRLKVGDPRSGATWAPVYVSYGYNNRTQMLRVPAPGRVEDRTVDGSCNPYLAATVLLAAGLDGIERELDAGRPEHAQPVRVDAGAARRAGDRHAAGEPARRDARARARRRDPARRSARRATATTSTTSSRASGARCRPPTSRSRSGSSTATSSSSEPCAGSSDCSRSTRRRGAARRAPRRDAGPARRPRARLGGRRDLPRAGAALGSTKLSLFSADPDEDWAALGDATVHAEPRGRRARGRADAVVERAARATCPHLRVMSAGDADRDLQGGGRPARVRRALRARGDGGLARARAHADGDREQVTTEGAHPFSTGLDLCLVHNGSLSNHNPLRRRLRHEGIAFQTENDTEVAAGYLEWRLREGDTLQAALERCLVDLDGFYTFAVGTADGFAVLRDPIACKPAVMAENDDWVAMASEYRAIAVLPGADAAEVWEPEPGRVYSWERANGRDGGRRGRSRPSTWRRRRCASSTAGCTRPTLAPRWRIAHPNGAHAVAVGIDADDRGRRRRPRGLLLRRHEQARDGARARQRGRRAGGEHHVRHGRRRRLRGPVVRGDRARRAGRRARRRVGALRDLDEGRATSSSRARSGT